MPEDFDPFAMSVLRPTETGVNGAVIWVAVGADDDPRLWVVVGDSIKAEELKSAVPVRLSSPPEVLGALPEVVAREVWAFIERNREALLGHWNGELDTREMLDVCATRERESPSTCRSPRPEAARASRPATGCAGSGVSWAEASSWASWRGRHWSRRTRATSSRGPW